VLRPIGLGGGKELDSSQLGCRFFGRFAKMAEFKNILLRVRDVKLGAVRLEPAAERAGGSLCSLYVSLAASPAVRSSRPQTMKVFARHA
jgi:hypothetical protein